jgi:hypothetical protein
MVAIAAVNCASLSSVDLRLFPAAGGTVATGTGRGATWNVAGESDLVIVTVVTVALAACTNTTTSSTGSTVPVSVVGARRDEELHHRGQPGHRVGAAGRSVRPGRRRRGGLLRRRQRPGGVDGRKIYLKYQADDTGSPTDDTTQARNLVEQDHVFAVVGVGTPFFDGASFFAAEGTPAFGYVVSQDWNNHPDLFGAYGSYLDYTDQSPDW